MKIELSGVKVARSLSEETLAFTAVVKIDGKPAYAAKNQGCGGCNYYDRLRPDAPSIQDIERFLIAQGKAKADDFEILDCYIGDLIETQESAKRLARMLKTKIVVLVDNKGQPALATYSAKFPPNATNIAKVAARGETVVNGNPALETRALQLV